MSAGKIFVGNPHLKEMGEDMLYHLGFSNKSLDPVKEFGDVKFVCLGGSAERMEEFAELLAKEAKTKSSPKNLAAGGHRYVLYRVGAVLIANHGMGTPSLSILLHELFKLIHYAGCKDVTFFRMGTSGGLGFPPGTLVVSTEGLNTALEPYYDLTILGKPERRPTQLTPELADELCELAKEKKMPVEKGKTVCANDFYEEQARLDGAFCRYTEKDKFDYLKRAYEKGARNMEMEATCFASQCKMAGVRAGIVCVTLVNRMKSDQVKHSAEEYHRLQHLPAQLLFFFLKKHNALY